MAEAVSKNCDRNYEIAITFKLTPLLTNLLGLLLAQPIVTAKQIEEAIKVKDAPVRVFRLRSALAPHFEIGTPIVKTRRSLGYWIDPEDKARIWEKVNATCSQPPTEQLVQLLAG